MPWSSCCFNVRWGILSIIFATFLRSFANRLWHTCLSRLSKPKQPIGRKWMTDAPWTEWYNRECRDSPVARHEGSYHINMISSSTRYWSLNKPAESPRITPIPAPLAIPLSKLFRAQGICVMFLTVFTWFYQNYNMGKRRVDSLELHQWPSHLLRAVRVSGEGVLRKVRVGRMNPNLTRTFKLESESNSWREGNDARDKSAIL